MSKNDIKKGELVRLTSGDYSDYCIAGLMKAEVDFNIAELLFEYKVYEKIEAKKYCWVSESEFLNWLINVKKCAREVDVIEAHLDGYGMGTISIWIKG